MDLIKISQLDQRTEITNDDFFPLVDSGSRTTYKSTMDNLLAYGKISASVPLALYAETVDHALTASYVPTASFAFTASYLYFTASRINGTASYALNTWIAATASYVVSASLVAAYATYALSASWASSSVSASYVPSTGVDGVVTSASYAITTSYAITSSHVISASHAQTASNAGTSSYAEYAVNVGTGVPFTIYGPFFADPAYQTTPSRSYGQYDEGKRSVAFILEEDSDVVIKCLANYSNNQLSRENTKLRFIGVKLRPEGVADPLTAARTTGFAHGNFDAWAAESIRDVNAAGTTDFSSELVFSVSNLAAGQYRVYFIPFHSTKNIGVLEYAVSASTAQQGDYAAFEAESINYADYLKFYKLQKAVQVMVYSKKNVIQGIYPPDGGGGSGAATWVLWKLSYTTNNNTIVNGQFEYSYTYESLGLGGGTAEWIGPMGDPGEKFTLYQCLPSDAILIQVTGGPIGNISSGPTKTAIACEVNGEDWEDVPCGGWYLVGPNHIPVYRHCN